MKQRTWWIAGLATLLASAVPGAPALAQDAADAATVAAEEREAVVFFLDRPEVRQAAESLNLDVAELAEGVATMSPAERRRVAGAVADYDQMAMADTITLTTTTIIIGLLVLIVLILIL